MNLVLSPLKLFAASLLALLVICHSVCADLLPAGPYSFENGYSTANWNSVGNWFASTNSTDGTAGYFLVDNSTVVPPGTGPQSDLPTAPGNQDSLKIGPWSPTHFVYFDRAGTTESVQSAFCISFSIPAGTNQITASFNMFVNNWHGPGETNDSLDIGSALTPNYNARVDIVNSVTDLFSKSPSVIAANLYTGGGDGNFNYGFAGLDPQNPSAPFAAYSIPLTVGTDIQVGDYFLRFAVANYDNTVSMGIDDVSIEADNSSAVPEPSTFILLGLGVLGLCISKRL